MIYPLSQVPERIRWLVYLNPLTAPVETFKWAVLPGMQHSWGVVRLLGGGHHAGVLRAGALVLRAVRERDDGQAVSQQWEITARPQGLVDALADVWRHRGLLGFIGDRALRKIYRRTVLGWLWLFINPLFPLALRALIFGALLGVGVERPAVLPLPARRHDRVGHLRHEPDVGDPRARDESRT